VSARPAPGRYPFASFSPRRVSALVLRYGYLLMGSWARALELAYWPTVQIILWGFISKHFAGGQTTWAGGIAGALLAAVLLWDILFRGQLGYTISFLEELWSRNLGQLFISPLRPYELVLSLTIISLIRALIGVGPAILIAIPLYGFSLFDLGLPLVGFFANLMITGWALGLFTALCSASDAGKRRLMALFLIAPVSAILSRRRLPAWLRGSPVAAAAYVRGMRAILFDSTFRG
jgi:ABC-2 type transport system permease protein